MTGAIPLSHLTIDDAIRQAALGALESGRYILAEQCAAFERELAAYVGRKHCVLSSSWTAAVQLLHIAQGVTPGDEIIVPSHTAFPSIEPMIHAGARPVFVDVDDSYCLDPLAVAAALTPRTVGVIPVHLYGHPADLDPILALARKRGIWVLEDCAQSHGAMYKGRRTGAIGDASAFSFYPSKNLSVCGDGGCIMTDDDAIAGRVRMLRDHGRKSKFTHDAVGFNLRFNEIQAAIGRVILGKLDGFNAQRRLIARRYDKRLKGLVATPPERDWAQAVYHMYVIRTPRRDALQKHLADRGIGTGIHYPVPNHRQPAIVERYKAQPPLPRTEAAVGEILSLPIFGEMTLEQADRVCEAIAGFFSGKR